MGPRRSCASPAKPPKPAATLADMAARLLNGDISELARGRAIRLEAGRRAPMSERLARVHILCKQMSAIKGAARDR